MADQNRKSGVLNQELKPAGHAEKVENTDSFPCPTCGGTMNFDPDAQALLCPYCNNRIDIANQEGDIHEYDLTSAAETANTNWGNEKRVIQCQSCGAKTVLDATTTAQFCAFCGSAHVVKIEELAGIAPESLVPFKISRAKAQSLFIKWIRGRLFAPNALKSEYQNERMTGMYIPHWTYDADTHSTFSALAGTYYHVTETDRIIENGVEKTVARQVRKINWWPTSGTYSCYYDDITVNASRQIDDKLMQRLQPYRLDELVRYRPEFLSGFLAERYSRGLQEGWELAKESVRENIRHGITKKIGADEVRNLRVSTSFKEIKYKHILLPVWISSYTYQGKVYQYMVNGQTGEIQGRCPISPWKVAIAILIGIICIAGAFWYVNHR